MVLAAISFFMLTVVFGLFISLFKVLSGLMWTLVIIGVLVAITNYIINKFDIKDGE